MSIARLLQQNATIYAKTGYNKHGRDISSATGVLTKCRFENVTKTKTDKDGQQVLLSGKVFLKGDTTIATEDRLVIDGISYKVFSVNGDIDGRGNQVFIECEVSKWQTT